MDRDEIQAKLHRIKPGVRVGGEPAREAEHFMICPECGQAFDMRNLAEVFHHEQPDHQPLTRE